MPKAILEFNIPDEQDEFETACNAQKYRIILWELDQFLRNKIKHASDDTSDDYLNALQTVRDEFWVLLEENNLNLD